MSAGVYPSISGGPLEARLGPGPCVLDGATGTELERRGISTGLPLWSAAALSLCPEIVERIHADYASAGVDLLTANTFRTQRRTLERAGMGDQAAHLTQRAVELARRGAAAGGGGALVLGSAPTLEDCYRPDLVPDTPSLEREHTEHAEHLMAAGVDGILVETMNSVREAGVAARAARSVGAPLIVSFVCWDGAQLLSGEPLELALQTIGAHEPLLVAVNCLPPSNVPACLPTLAASGIRFGAYANLGAPDDAQGFTRSEDSSPEEFAGEAQAWLDAGAHLVGGCCGTTPAHLAAVARRVHPPEDAGTNRGTA